MSFLVKSYRKGHGNAVTVSNQVLSERKFRSVLQEKAAETKTYAYLLPLAQSRTLTDKFPGGREQRKKQDRKIAPLSLPLLYRYHV